MHRFVFSLWTLSLSSPGWAVCSCTAQQKVLTLVGVGVLLALVGLTIFWMVRRQLREAGQAQEPAQVPGSFYRVTASFQVYDLRSREVVYRARSRAEALGWVERTLQLNPPFPNR